MDGAEGVVRPRPARWLSGGEERTALASAVARAAGEDRGQGAEGRQRPRFTPVRRGGEHLGGASGRRFDQARHRRRRVRQPRRRPGQPRAIEEARQRVGAGDRGLLVEDQPPRSRLCRVGDAEVAQRPSRRRPPADGDGVEDRALPRPVRDREEAVRAAAGRAQRRFGVGRVEGHRRAADRPPAGQHPAPQLRGTGGRDQDGQQRAPEHRRREQSRLGPFSAYAREDERDQFSRSARRASR